MPSSARTARSAAPRCSRPRAYTLEELLGDARLVAKYRDGVFATLRLTSNIYHRFHAPCDARVREVIYICGDTWNVNPIALKRVERLYCKNERALIDLDLGRAAGLLLVPVAATLVASIRLHCLTLPLTLTYRGPNRLACDATYAKGDEMGWFEHGSTILAFGTKHFALSDRVRRRADRDGPAAHARDLKHRRARVPRDTTVIHSSQIVPMMNARSASAACGSDE